MSPAHLNVERFDNSKHNIILISDHTDTLFMSKTIGPYKVARELRLAGYEVAVLHHIHIFPYEEIEHILTNLISAKTLFVGFNNMFYKTINKPLTNELHKDGIMYSDKELGSMLPHGIEKNISLKTCIKNANPTCKLVLGGPTAINSELNQDFDYVVVGYADISVVNLANHLAINEPLKKSYKSISGPIIISDAKAEGFDFVNSQMEYKSYDCILPGETLPLEVARGCIFDCAFCSYPLNGKKKLDFIKRVDLLTAELNNNYKKFGITRYLMGDDTFNDAVEKAQMIYEVSKQLPFNLEYWAFVRLDLMAAHPETIDPLFNSGLRACHFGIETFNKDSGKSVGKGMDKERLLSTLSYIKSKWGDQVMLHGSFIAGLPHETVDSLNETFDILMDKQRCPLDSWIMHPFLMYDKSTGVDGFSSRITKDPESYGYRPLNKIPNTDNLDWETDHLNYSTVVELSEKFNQQASLLKRNKISGSASFFMASLGFELGFSANKIHFDFDWHTVNLKKQDRSDEYKTKFYRLFNLPKFPTQDQI